MDIEIDLSINDRTERQNNIVDQCHKAVKILRCNGINAKVIKYIVTSETSRPASIVIDDD